jgi:hypothetical protein
VIAAAGLIGSTALLVVRARRAVTDAHRLMAGRATQGVIGVIPLLLAAYFLLGRRLDWTVLVIGLAWRGWLLLHSLPALAAALSAPRPQSAGAGRPAVDG